MVSPLYKSNKNDRSNAENYRPISLTSIVSKILEHILHSNIMDHLNKNKILRNVQHGFRNERSCETQLILTINDFAKALNQGEQIDSILLDFAKAFDKVSHSKLIYKLEHYGVSRKTVNWIKDFLSDRKECVIINGKYSR